MPELRAPRRIQCPIPGHEAAYVVLPAEWLGVHWIRRDDVVEAAGARIKHPVMLRAAIALAVADDWENVPGLGDKHDPATWDLAQMPIGILIWLVDAVYTDFARAFEVPKG
jgi:hypothetical protein